MISIINKFFILFFILFSAVWLSACSDDKDEILPLPQGQGEVTFKFVRNTLYTVSSLEEMARLKVTLEKDGKQIVLPTFDLSGTTDSLSTPVVRLENGVYKVKKYIAFNAKGNQVQEAFLDEDNLLTVEHGSLGTFYFPISIRIIFVNNQLRNQLFGICNEIFGADSTRWPKSWRIENEYLGDWENLEFDVDDYGNLIALNSIRFDEKFAGMKKLPATVSMLTTLQVIQVINLPEFEELPDNMDQSNISGITLINTGLKAFPKNFEKMKNFYSLVINGSRLTEIPVRLGELEHLRLVEICDSPISSFPAELADKWNNVVSLSMTGTQLSSLPSNIFGMKKVGRFDFSNNPNLSSLPATRGDTRMGTLMLDRCGFTSIPDIARTRMLVLSMADNKLTSVSKETLNALSDQLETLNLSGNQLRSFPQMTSASLMELKLDRCGLTAWPDVTKLPNLRLLSLSANELTSVPAGAFTGNPYLCILDLSRNTPLTTISTQAGFNMIPQTEVQHGVPVTVSKPYYLNMVNVDSCPNLVWKVPATWCCVKNIPVGNKEDAPLAPRNVVVMNNQSPGVTREVCPVCGKSSYPLPVEFGKTF